MPPKKKIADKVDKRFRQKVVVGHDIDGKPIVKYASGKTKKELAQNVDELKKRYIGGTEVQRDVIFETYLMEWYYAYKEPHIGEGSKRNYESVIRKHILPAFMNRQLRSITAIELQAFINQFAGRGKTQITYISAVLSGMFGEAASQGIIDKDPAQRLRKPEHSFTPRRALTDAEVKAALHVGHTHPNGLLLLILYYLGLRKGEALGLRIRDINFIERTIAITRDIDYVTYNVGELKTPESERELPIPNDLFGVLSPFRYTADGFLFSNDGGNTFWSSSTYMRNWNKLAAAMFELDPSIEHKVLDEETGLIGSVLTAHYFRHNYATFLYDAGVDVLTAQKYLGHKDVTTTLKIYTQLKSFREKQSAARLKTAFDTVSNTDNEKLVAKRLPERGKVVELRSDTHTKNPRV